MGQAKQRIEIHMIGQDTTLAGHSFMFPSGSKVRINKRVDDHKEGKSVYHGYFSNPMTKTGYEVQFDARTNKHLSWNDGNQKAYEVTLDVTSLDLSTIPAIP